MDRIFESLVELHGRLGPGKRLPAERALAEEWGISRVTLRDRVRQLEALGLLEKRGTAGTFTRDIDPTDLARLLSVGFRATPLADAATFESVRIALDRQAVLLAAERREPVPLAYAEKAVRVMESSADPDALLAADRAFHRSLIEASGDRGLIFFAEAVDDLIAQSLAARGSGSHRLEHREAFVTMHRRLLDAVTGGDRHTVLDAVQHHYDDLRSRQPEPAHDADAQAA